MEKHFTINQENAKAAAERFAANNNGQVRRQMAILDSQSLFDCICDDDEAAQLDWSGEVNAYEVIDQDYNTMAYFAYWE